MPDFRDLFMKASQLQMAGNTAAAMPFFQEILLERPDFFPAWNARGAALQSLGAAFDAVLCYNKAIELNPNAGEYYNNRGAAWMDLERFEKAIEDFKLALMMNNKIPEIHNNRGNALMRLRRPAEAAECYRAAYKLRSDYADAHVGEAMAQLMLGQLEDGFKNFEWRWRSGPMKARGLMFPNWEGEEASSPDDILLLYGEQGLGDALQFVRYAKPVKERWKGKVYIEVMHPLTRLVRDVEGVDGVVTLGERVPPTVKCCVAMLSAPRVLGTTLETIPAEIPYLKYDEHRAAIWRSRLQNPQLVGKLKVGICWAGSNREQDRLASTIDSRRSMDLSLFKPLGGIQDVAWVSLQLGPPKEQLRNNPAGMTCYDGTNDLYDFFDTAALIACCDLIISVDTSVAHVAGALGKPTWMLSRYDACWRWLMDRDDTPWYPTMRLFTQKRPHDWAEVVDRVHRELLKLVNEHRLSAVA